MAEKSRRWYQFSILAALILTTVAALLVAMFVVPAQRQRAAVAQILAAGGQVTYKHQWRVGAVPGTPPPPPGPMWLRNLIGPDYFQTVYSVTLLDAANRRNAVAEVLSASAKLPSLHRLVIDGPMSADELDTIGTLKPLTCLVLSGPVADAEMPRLGGLTELSELHCAACRMTLAIAEISEVWLKDVSPRDTIDYFSQRHEIKSRFDEATISAAGIDLDSMALTRTLSGIPLGQMLTQLLEPEGLGYRIEDNVLVITTREEAERAHAGINELKRRLPNLKTVEVGW